MGGRKVNIINNKLQYCIMRCTKCDIELNDENHIFKSSKKNGRKICDSCLREKYKEYYIKNYEKERVRKKQYYIKNKEKLLAYSKEYRAKHIEEKKDYNLRRAFGIGLDDVQKMLELQKYKCKICGGELELIFGGRNKKSPHLDHDHLTGKVRGILCHSCNLVLGFAYDNSEILERAVEYLNSYKIEVF